jgi:hypothetical protein
MLLVKHREKFPREVTVNNFLLFFLNFCLQLLFQKPKLLPQQRYETYNYLSVSNFSNLLNPRKSHPWILQSFH